MVRLVVVVLPVPVGEYIIEYALVEPPTDTYWAVECRPVLATVMPAKVTIVLPLMAHAPPLTLTVSVRVFREIAPVIKALPIMKASGVPAMGILVKVIGRVPPGAMGPAVDLNPMTKFWQVLLTWHDGMVTELTWYPEMGPLGEPELCESMVV